MRDSLEARDSILVIGASGQLGLALCQEFGSTYNVVAASRSYVDRGQHYVDLADEPGLIRLLDDVQANTILIAAAMCHVDRCELEPKVCHSVNVTGTEIIARHASRNGALVVFFSTDHVFNGTQKCYSEDDEMAPLNVYADSKSKAELALRRYVPDRHLILRTSWVYGPDRQRRNFILRMVDQMGQQQTWPVPADQWGSPTYTDDLAKATRMLIKHGHTGTFHATGPEFVSRVDLARRVCVKFGLDSSRLEPRLTETLGQAARRPLMVRLNCQKLHEAGGNRFRDIDAGLTTLSTWRQETPGCQQ